MSKIKHALKLLATCAIYSLIVGAGTLVAVLIMVREVTLVKLFLTYGLLLEGGFFLVVGGAMASFSPTFGRIRENIFHTTPVEAKSIRESERQARLWIATGGFLFLFGLFTSTL